MDRIPAILACFLLAALFHPQILNAQGHRRAKLNESVALPMDFSLDYQLGLAERGKIRGGSALLENTPYNEAGTGVFSKFVQDASVTSLNLPIVGTSRLSIMDR